MPVTTTTVRVPAEVRDTLHELAGESGDSMTHILIEAVDLFRRQRLLLATNDAYARIAASGEDVELAEEYADLDGVLMDGLTSDVSSSALAG